MCQKNTLHGTYKAEFFSTDFNELHTNFRQYTVKSTVSKKMQWLVKIARKSFRLFLDFI